MNIQTWLLRGRTCSEWEKGIKSTDTGTDTGTDTNKNDGLNTEADTDIDEKMSLSGFQYLQDAANQPELGRRFSCSYSHVLSCVPACQVLN